ncbi:MAG: hypothetical protein AB7T06_24620 [Kofleriaceae bacterium]
MSRRHATPPPVTARPIRRPWHDSPLFALAVMVGIVALGLLIDWLVPA